MTRKKGIALIICLTLIISMALPGTLAVSTDQAGTNDNVTFTSGNDQTPPSAPEGQQQGQQEEQHEPENPIPPENPTEGEQACTECGKTGTHAEPCSRYVAPAEPEKTCTCDPQPAEGGPHGEGCPFYTSVMGTAAAAEGTDSPVTEPAAGQIHIKINVFCVDDSNEAIPQPGVTVEVRRELYGDYYGNGEELTDWKDGLSMFSGTSDTSGVVYIDVPYTVVKDPDNAANDTAYLGNGETNDNDHVVYQRRADTDAFCIRFAIEPVNGSGYALNGADQKIRNWKNGQNGINVHLSDGDGYAYDDFVFQSGLVDIDSQTGTAGGAFVEFDLYVKKTTPAEEPTTEEPTKETVNINYVPVGPAGATNFGSVAPVSETVMVESGPAGATNFVSVAPVNETVMVESGPAVGSTPTPETGFKFVGWFKDQACTQPVDAAWIENNKIIPQKTTEAYEAATYYAKFEYDHDLADLIISKADCEAIDENQSFIFDVTGPNGYYKRVVIKGTGSVTITGLEVGKYTVTEVTSWSWRYTTGGSPSITLQGAPTKEVIFTNNASNSKWLSGNAYSKIVFGNK